MNRTSENIARKYITSLTICQQLLWLLVENKHSNSAHFPNRVLCWWCVCLHLCMFTFDVVFCYFILTCHLEFAFASCHQWVENRPESISHINLNVKEWNNVISKVLKMDLRQAISNDLQRIKSIRCELKSQEICPRSVLTKLKEPIDGNEEHVTKIA